MSVYLIAGTFISLLALYSYNKKNSVGIILSIFLPIFLISALRYDIGTDYSAYQIIFDNPQLMATREKGFMFLNSVIKEMGLPFQFVIICFTVTTLVLIFTVIIENSDNIILSIFLFYMYTPFFLDSMNAIRQWFAIAVFLYSTRFIKKRKILLYLLFIFFAAFFAHKSVLVTIPLYFIVNKKFKRITRVIFIASCFFMSQIITPIVKASPYAIYTMGSGGAGKLSPVFILDIILVAYVVLFLKDYDNPIFYNLTLISFGLMLIAVQLVKLPVFNPVFRLNEYFLFSLCLTLPSCLNAIKKKKRKIICITSILFFSLLNFVSLYFNGERNEICPYQIFFGRFSNDFLLDFGIVLLGTSFSMCCLLFACLKRNKYLSRNGYMPTKLAPPSI